ncbi:MAG: tetratricopeptide repeat-containing sensor histidine kinase [Bacteroidota bacterium]
MAQENKRDSLWSKLKVLETISSDVQDDKYIDILNELSKEYRFVKEDSVYSLARKALELSKSQNYILGECEALDNLGGFYSDNGKNHEAISHFKEALRLADSIDESKAKIGILNDLANEFSYLGNYEKALKNFLMGLDLAKETDNKVMQSILNENIASLYIAQKEFDQALEFYNQVKELNEEIGDEIIIAETLSNLADLYADMKNYEHAMFNINKSISTFEKEEIFDWLAFAYSVKGEIYLKQKKYKWALYWYDQSNLLHEKLEDDRSRIDLLNGMASAYLGLGEDEKSNDYALEAFEISSNIKSLEGQRDCAKTLYKISKNKGNFEKALQYHEVFQQLSDSINKDENKRSLTLLKTKLKYDKDKELLIAKNEKELARQQNLINASIIILMVLLAAAIPLYFNQKKLKKLYRELQFNTENLRENQMELNAINSTKDKLFSIIGHDLRGPIGALQGLLKLMVSGEIAKKDFSKFIPKLRGDVDHILFTLNNLLSWGYSQMNGTVTKPKMVNFNKLVESSINLLSEMASNKSINIMDQLPKECLILADEDQMDIVVRNLISNAIKFTPDNGLITLEAEEMEKCWKIKIRDTGIGMDERTRKKLFKDNSNITTYGTNNEKGTGLGLSLCKEMVEKNKGEIWVESIPKKGSTFYFTIPKITKKYRRAS